MKNLMIVCIWIVLTGLGQAQPLDTLILRAVETHPLMQSLHHEYEALLYNERVQSSWDAPIVNIGAGVFPIETRVGPQILKIGAQQRISYGGSQRAKRQIVKARQYGVQSQTDLMHLELAYEVKRAYYDLFILEQKDKLLDRMLLAIQAQREDRLRSVRSGTGMTSQVLLMERTLRTYREKQKQLQYDKAEAQAQLSYLTGIDTISNLELGPEFISAIGSEVPLLPELEAQHPQIEQHEARVQAASAEMKALKWANYPQLTVGIDYFWNASRANVDIPDNGRDALIPMVGIQLPFLSSKNSRQQEEWKQKEMAAEYQRQNEVRQIQSELISAFERLSKSRSEYEYLDQQIEITDRLLKLAKAKISSNSADFYEYWLLVEEKLEFQWKTLEATQKAQEAYFFISKYNKP